MSTPNLNLDHINEGQTNKETTANAAFDGLDNAQNRVLEIVASGGTIDLTADQFRLNYLLVFSGTPGGEFTVTVPPGISRHVCFANVTPNSLFVEFASAVSDAIEVPAGETATFVVDGPNAIIYNLAIGSTGSGGGGPTQSGVRVEDEGAFAAQAETINFTGPGVNASENSDGTVDVTIPGARPTTFVNISTTTFEITDAHLVGNVIIRANNAGAITCFLEAGTTNTEPVTIIQTGAGAVTFVDASAVSMKARGGTITGGRYAAVSVIPEGGDSFFLVGDLTE